MKLSFKVNHPTGQFRAFDHTQVDIKGDKFKVGSIFYDRTRGHYKVLLHVVPKALDNADGRPFINKTLVAAFEGNRTKAIADARQWVTDKWQAIQEIHTLYQVDKPR